MTNNILIIICIVINKILKTCCSFSELLYQLKLRRCVIKSHSETNYIQ